MLVQLFTVVYSLCKYQTQVFLVRKLAIVRFPCLSEVGGKLTRVTRCLARVKP